MTVNWWKEMEQMEKSDWGKLTVKRKDNKTIKGGGSWKRCNFLKNCGTGKGE